MRHAASLVLCVFSAVAQQKPPAASAPHVAAYSADRDLTKAESAQLLDLIRKEGAIRIESPIFDERGVVIVKTPDSRAASKVSAALSSSALGKVGLQELPVERHGEYLTVRSGRFLVYFPKDLDPAEARRKLGELRFEIVDEPTRVLPAYCVQRSRRPENFSRERTELEAIPGVRFVVPDSLTLTLR